MIDCSAWTFRGLLSTTRFANGNQVGATCAFMALTKPDDWGKFLLALADFYGQDGLYYTDPIHSPASTCKIDDYIAIVASSPGCARRVVIRMSQHWGFLSEEGDWRFERWFYRFPGFVAHAIYSTDQKPGFFWRLGWAVSMWLCTRKSVSEQDAWTQSDLMARAYLGGSYGSKRSWLCDKAVEHWKRKRPKPIWQIEADYIGAADHPLVLAWKEAGEI